MKTDKAKEDFVDINYLRIADKESLILIKSEAEKTTRGTTSNRRFTYRQIEQI